MAQSGAPPPAYNDIVEQPSSGDVDNLAAEVYHNLKLNSDSVLPTEDHALAHLRLLHLFNNLRVQVSSTDGLFGLHNDDVIAQFAGPDVHPEIQARLLATLAEKRWAVYLTRAVDRFANWWDALKKSTHCRPVQWTDMQELIGNPLRSQTQASGFEQFLKEAEKPYVLQTGQLPPLDVLMVWHAYMLNPRTYLEDCLVDGAISLWRMGMPWEIVNACIDPNSEEYNPPVETKSTFEKASNLTWDNLDGMNESVKPCPNIHCRKLITLTYTTIDRLDITQWARGCAGDKEVDMPPGNGYADKDLQSMCPVCNVTINHDSLRAAKFVADYAGVVNVAGNNESLQRPMRGTILTNDGLVARLKSFEDPRTFPNRLLMAMATTDRPLWDATDMEMIRKSIEQGLRSPRTLQKAARVSYGRRSVYSRQDRIFIRRMMSRYWESSTPFGLDLVGAVVRQGSFIEKMINIDWLHSPTARSTMSRLIQKYTRFFYIMATNPNTLIVPTLDVDLAWHTHQLSPKQYYDYSVKKTKTKFINHDDKVPELSLNNAFAETSKLYQNLYKEPYSECTCWYCEAIRATHHSGLSRMFSRSIPPEESSLYDPANPAPCDPQIGPHISAHNAARPNLPPVYTAEGNRYGRLVEQSEKSLMSAYTKACKRAEKQGRKPPPKPPILDRGYGSMYAAGGIGFGVLAVSTIPFMAPYCDSNVHACDPTGANLGPGQAGNCAAGTCGGGVAAGGCGSGAMQSGWGGGGGAACGGAGNVGGGGCGGGGGFFGGGGCGGGGGGSACGGGGGGCGGGGGGGGCGGGGGG